MNDAHRMHSFPVPDLALPISGPPFARPDPELIRTGGTLPVGLQRADRLQPGPGAAGDILIADDDGAVLVPSALASLVAERTLEHEDWERFSRMRLAAGGALQKYCPLDDEGRQEYEQWRREQGA
jgi:hypothetical protein